MSTKRTYKIETSSIVVIKTIVKTELDHLESSLITMIEEKISRMKPHLSSCKIALIDHIIVIQDELGIFTDIEELMKSYGMNVIKIENEKNIDVKGNTYIATDELLELFELIQGSKESLYRLFSSIYHMDTDLKYNIGSQVNIYKPKLQIENLKDLKENQFIKEMISTVKQNQEVKVIKTEQAMVTDYDGITISKTIISSHSNEKDIISVEKKLRDTIQSVNTNHLGNIVQGTTKSLEIRAKKLGYVVTKKKNGENIQLVLVRER